MRGKTGPLPPFRRETARLKPYRVANPPHRIKLNQNESPVELPLRIKRSITRALLAEPWSRYPDYPPERAAVAIGKRFGLPASRVLVGHGSNELIYAAALTTLERGKSMIAPSPSYAVAHLAARLAGGRVRTVPLGRRFKYETEKLIDAIRKERPRLVFLPSPNNPTGTSLTVSEADAIAGAARCVVLIDEAYAEFSGARLTPLLERHRNLVLLRTFSKAFRLAGLRIGYLLGDEEVLHRIERGKPPHSIDRLGLIAAETISGESGLIAKETAKVVRERDRVTAALAAMDRIDPYRSDANFILLRVPDGERIHRKLLARGILVRNVGAGAGRQAGRDSIPVDRRLRHCLRVTIGARKENDAFLNALERILKEKA